MHCLLGPCKRLRRNWRRGRPARIERVLSGRVHKQPKATNLVPIRPTEPSRDDHIGALFDMLADAIDRYAAQQLMEDQLPGIGDVIRKAHRQMDELFCARDSVEERAKTMPALQIALEGSAQTIERLQMEIDQNVELQQLLKQRLRKSRQQLSSTLR